MIFNLLRALSHVRVNMVDHMIPLVDQSESYLGKIVAYVLKVRYDITPFYFCSEDLFRILRICLMTYGSSILEDEISKADIKDHKNKKKNEKLLDLGLGMWFTRFFLHKLICI